MANNTLKVWVAYALPEKQWVEALQVPAGSTLADVLKVCEKLTPFADLDLSQAKVGIYGQIAEREQIVQAGDRIEIYRPLIVDPMTARRLRAQHRAGKKKKA